MVPAIRDPRSAWLKPAAVSGQALLAQDAHSQPEPHKVSEDSALMEQHAEDVAGQLGLESRCALRFFGGFWRDSYWEPNSAVR